MDPDGDNDAPVGPGVSDNDADDNSGGTGISPGFIFPFYYSASPFYGPRVNEGSSLKRHPGIKEGHSFYQPKPKQPPI